MVGRHHVVAALVAATIASPAVVRAECNDEEREKAVPHVVAGREAFAEQDHEKGLAQFQAANDYCPDAWLLPYIAVAQVRTGRYVEALETMQAFEESNAAVPPVPSADDDSVEAKRARQRIAAFQEMDAMRRRALRSVATVVLKVEPRDATVFIDGQQVATKAGAVELRENAEKTIVVKVSSLGRDEEREVTFVPGERLDVTLDLSPTPAPVPTPTAPATTAARDGGGLFYWGLAIAGVGLVPLGLGVAAVVDAQSASSDVTAQRNQVEAECQGGLSEQECSQRTALVEDNQSSVDTRRTLGWAGVVAGGVITTTGLILTFALSGDSGGDGGDRVSTAVDCGFGLGALSCKGTF